MSIIDTRIGARLYNGQVEDEDGQRVYVEATKDEGDYATVQINAFTVAGEGAIAQIVLDREAAIAVLAQIAHAVAIDA